MMRLPVLIDQSISRDPADFRGTTRDPLSRSATGLSLGPENTLHKTRGA